MSLDEIQSKIEKNASSFFNIEEGKAIDPKQFMIDLQSIVEMQNKAQLLDYISSGAQGIVLKASDTINGAKTLAALKIMKVSQDAQNELIMLGKVKQLPFCLKIEKSYTFQSQKIQFLVLVTEFCQQNLQTYINSFQQQEIPIDIKRRLISQCLICLYSLHSQYPKIIHRDIKPENILLDDNLNIRLADFGFACEITDYQFRRDFLGTVIYLAPELREQQQIKYNDKADIFSMGCVFAKLNNTKLTTFTYVSEYMSKVSSVEVIVAGDKKIIPNLLSKMSIKDPEERASARDCLRIIDPVFDFSNYEGMHKEETNNFGGSPNNYTYNNSFSNIYQNPINQGNGEIKEQEYTLHADNFQDENIKLKQQIKELQDTQTTYQKQLTLLQQQQQEQLQKQQTQQTQQLQQSQQLTQTDQEKLNEQQKNQLIYYGCIGLFKFVMFLMLMVVAIMNETHEVVDRRDIGVIIISLIELICGAVICFFYVRVQYLHKMQYSTFHKKMKYYIIFSIVFQYILAFFTNLVDRKGQNGYIIGIILLQIIIHSPLVRLSSIFHQCNDLGTIQKYYYKFVDIVGVYTELHSLFAIILAQSIEDQVDYDEDYKSLVLFRYSCTDMRNTLIASAVFYTIFKAGSSYLSYMESIEVKKLIYFSRAFIFIDKIMLILECCFYLSDSSWQTSFSLVFYLASSFIVLPMTIKQGSFLWRKEFLNETKEKVEKQQSKLVVYFSCISQQVGSILIILYSRFSQFDDWLQDFGIAMGCILFVFSLLQNFELEFPQKFVRFFIPVSNLFFFSSLMGLAIKSENMHGNVLAFDILTILTFVGKLIAYEIILYLQHKKEEKSKNKTIKIHNIQETTIEPIKNQIAQI